MDKGRERMAAAAAAAAQCRSPRCAAERRGFRRELDSWRHRLMHCVGKRDTGRSPGSARRQLLQPEEFVAEGLVESPVRVSSMGERDGSGGGAAAPALAFCLGAPRPARPSPLLLLSPWAPQELLVRAGSSSPRGSRSPALSPELLGAPRRPPSALSGGRKRLGGSAPGRREPAGRAGGRKAGWSAPPPGAHTPPSCRWGPSWPTRPSSRGPRPGRPPGARGAGVAGGLPGARGGGGVARGAGAPTLPSRARRRRRCVYPFKKQPLER